MDVLHSDSGEGPTPELQPCPRCGEPTIGQYAEDGERWSDKCDECRTAETPFADPLPSVPSAWLAEVFPPGHSAQPELRVVSAADTEIEQTVFLVPELLPLGAVSLLVGDPGLGKSTLTADWAAGVSRGAYGAPGAVLMANAEDSPAHVTVPRLLAAGADLDRVAFFDVTEMRGERAFTVPDDVPLLEAHAVKIGARLVVVDPLNAHLADGTNAHRDHSMRRALAPLSAMAQRIGAAVVVVAHLNKATGGDALYRISGSIGLPGAARSALLFARDPDDPDGEAGDRRALGHVKSNWGRLAPTTIHEHRAATVERHGVSVETHRLVLIGESDAEGAELLTPDREDPPATARERAAELLADVLGDGEWHRAKEVEAAAGRVGVRRRTLYRAATDVGVEKRHEGFPRVSFWRLPVSCDTGLGTTVVPTELSQLENPYATGDPESAVDSRVSASGVVTTGQCEQCGGELTTTPVGLVCEVCETRQGDAA